jgi:hypothetical protein
LAVTRPARHGDSTADGVAAVVDSALAALGGLDLVVHAAADAARRDPSSG